MSVKKIQVADAATLSGNEESILRKRCSQVVSLDDNVMNIVQDLRDTLHSDKISVGLAAPQIGYNIAIAVVNLDKNNNQNDLVLINPVIDAESGQWDEKYESCMSIPHKKGKVKRRKKVSVRYLDFEGKEQEIKTSGFEARVIMHEIDHLNGILFVDRMADGAVLEDTDMFREIGIE